MKPQPEKEPPDGEIHEGDEAKGSVEPSPTVSKDCIAPGDFIDVADRAGLPKKVRKIMPCTVGVYQAVADLKTKQHLGESAGCD